MPVSPEIQNVLDKFSMRSRAKYLEQALDSKQTGISVGDYLLELIVEGKDDEADYWLEGLVALTPPQKEQYIVARGIWVEPSDNPSRMWNIGGVITTENMSPVT
jgi:hypothetical protein